MTEKDAKKERVTRIRRSKKQIVLDKITAIYKDVPEDVLTANLEKIEKVLNVLDEAKAQVKKTRRLNFDRLTKGKSKEEIAFIIEQLQKKLAD